MNTRSFICLDFESVDRDVSLFQKGIGCEPCQVALAVINPRNLRIGETFQSLMRPLLPDTIQDEALAVNKKTREELALAPHPEVVWKDVISFCRRVNPSGKPFFAPIPVGYNIIGFDMKIVQRLCELYGPTDPKTGRQTLFSDFMSVDLMHDIFRWTENSNCIPNMKLDTVRDWLGMSKEGAHDALQDVRDTAAIFVKFVKFYRKMFPKVRFANSMGEADAAQEDVETSEVAA